MRPKSLLLLVLALGCGLVASIGISQVMDRNANQASDVETVPIYVAVHNINLGDPIDANMVSLQEWPKDRIPPGAISQLEDLQGRRPRTAIIEGEPILEGKLLKPGPDGRPDPLDPQGHAAEDDLGRRRKERRRFARPWRSRRRATVREARQRTTASTPPSRKSFCKTSASSPSTRPCSARPTVAKSAAIAKTISLLLTPEQASKLTLAEHIGEISLIPRNPDDEEAANTAEFTVDDLLSDGGKSSRKRRAGRAKESKRRTADAGQQPAGRDSGARPAAEAAVPHGNRRSPGRPRSAVRRRNRQPDSRPAIPQARQIRRTTAPAMPRLAAANVLRQRHAAAAGRAVDDSDGPLPPTQFGQARSRISRSI